MLLQFRVDELMTGIDRLSSEIGLASLRGGVVPRSDG